MKIKLPSDMPLNGQLPLVAIQRATVHYDFTNNTPVRVSIEGVLRVDEQYPLDIEAEVVDLIVTCPATGRRYKLEPIEEGR